MDSFEAVDFFSDASLVNDPHPYFGIFAVAVPPSHLRSIPWSQSSVTTKRSRSIETTNTSRR